MTFEGSHEVESPSYMAGNHSVFIFHNKNVTYMYIEKLEYFLKSCFENSMQNYTLNMILNHWF